MSDAKTLHAHPVSVSVNGDTPPVNELGMGSKGNMGEAARAHDPHRVTIGGGVVVVDILAPCVIYWQWKRGTTGPSCSCGPATSF